MQSCIDFSCIYFVRNFPFGTSEHFRVPPIAKGGQLKGSGGCGCVYLFTRCTLFRTFM